MQKRDALLFTILSVFVPFATLYWLYAVSKDLQKAYNIKPPSLILLLAPLVAYPLGLMALLFTATLNGDNAGLIGILLLIGLLLLIPLSILPLIYMYIFSGNVEKIAGKQLDRILVFILLLFIAPAAVYIVQDRLNTIIAQQPPAPTPPSGVF